MYLCYAKWVFCVVFFLILFHLSFNLENHLLAQWEKCISMGVNSVASFEKSGAWRFQGNKSDYSSVGLLTQQPLNNP